MLQRIISIVLLATVLLVACAPAVTPVPVAPTVAPVEPTAVPAELTIEPGPEPFKLTWWSEYGSLCCSDTRDDLTPDGINQPGDLGRWIIEEWHRLYPEYDHVEIEQIIAQYGEDAEVELDTLIAAGEAPNILEGYGGRMGTYKSLGVPLEDYYTKEMTADFLPGRFESLFDEDGHIRMASCLGSFYYPVINVALFERAGIEVPESWAVVTWEELEKWGQAIQALDEDAYLACAFAVKPTAAEWMWIPWASAGVSMYENNDFTQIAFNRPQAVGVFEWLMDFELRGYIAPKPSGLSVFDCIDYFKQGKTAIFLAQLGSARAVMNAAVEAGLLTEPFEIRPILTFGTTEGITPLVVAGSGAAGAIVTEGTPEEYREVAFHFAHYVMTFPFATEYSLLMPYLKSQIERHAMPHPEEVFVVDYMVEHGIAEVGFTRPAFAEIRSLWSETITAVFLGVMTPEQALADFEQRAGEVIAK